MSHRPFALSDDHAHDGHHTADGIDTVHAKQGHEESSHGEDDHGEVHATGKHHDAHGHGPNDGSPLMWIPLLILCLGAIGAGYLGFKGTGDWFHHFLNPALTPAARVSEMAQDNGMAMGAAHAVSVHTGVEAAEPAERVGESVLLALGFILPIAGIGVAFYFYKLNRHAADIVGAIFGRWSTSSTTSGTSMTSTPCSSSSRYGFWRTCWRASIAS